MTFNARKGGALSKQPRTPQASWSGGGLLLMTLLVAALAGCSDPPTDPNENSKENSQENNRTIECTRGVPSSDNKSCINATSCGTDNNKCLEGFACYRDKCHQVECGEGLGECTRGVCNDNGICVSKSTCQAGDSDNSCIAGEVCINRQCEPAQKCDALPTCGTIDPACDLRKTVCVETNPCTGADSCRSTKFCNPDRKVCEDNKCLLPTGGEKDCAAEGGGICNRLTGACEDAEVCTQASECLDSTDLNVKKVCTPDLKNASATDKICQRFGAVCDATCRTQANCVYDETNLVMTCGDGTCQVMDDCGVSEYCNSGQCEALSSYQCDADAFEGTDGNNDKEHATDFASAQKSGAIKDLTLCKSDVDVFVIEDLSPYMGADELFIVDLQYDGSSRGRKIDAKLTVEYIEVDGSTAPPTESIKDSDTLNAKRTIAPSTTDEYHDSVVYYKEISKVLTDATKTYKAFIYVEHNSADADLGVGYSLKVSRSNIDVFKMCEAQIPLVFTDDGSGVLEARLKNQNLNSAATEAGSFPSEAACTDASKDIKEQAYSFTIEGTEPKIIDIGVQPQFSSGLDATLVILKNCESGIIDVNPTNDSGCREKNGPDTSEQYRTLLEPGDYTVVVTAKSKTAVGTGMYNLTVLQTPVGCDPVAANVCGTTTSKEVCDPYRQALMAPEECPTDEICHNYGNGEVGCTSDFGSFCSAPHIFKDGAQLTDLVIDTASMKGQSSGNSQFTCDGKLDRGQVSGGEVYLRGVIEPGHTAIVKAAPDAMTPVAITIYTMSACDATTCESGSFYSGDETATAVLTHTNSSNDVEEVIFVVETAGKGGKVTLNTEIVETASITSCVPGASSCDVTNPDKHTMTVCVDDGTGTGTYVEKTETCLKGLGCDVNGLPPACVRGGNTCNKAYPIASETLYDFTLSDYSNELGGYSDCTRQPSTTYGLTNNAKSDFIFKVEADNGDAVIVSVESSFDAVLWQIDGTCASLNAASPQCKFASDRGGKSAKEKLEVTSTGDPIYFVVEKWGAGEAETTNKFSVYVEVLKPNCSATLANSKPVCDTATGTISYCDGEDKLHKKVCPDGCLEGPARCDTTTTPDVGEGYSCGAPKMLTKSATAQTLQGAVNDGAASNSIELPLGLFGECSLEANGSEKTTSGTDYIYAVALGEGEVLEYRISTNSTSATYNARYRVYIVDDTCSAAGCRNMRGGEFVTSDGNPIQPNVQDWHKYHSRAVGTEQEVVYLVVDTMGQVSGTKHTLEYKVTTSATPTETEEPFWSHCDSATNSVIFKKADGTWSNATCPAGTTCEHGACKPAASSPGDECDDATIPLQNAPGFYVFETSNALAGVVDLKKSLSPTCGALAIDAKGTDYFFKIKVPDGKLLSVVGMSGSKTKPTVYIGNSCTKLASGDADACLAASVGSGTDYQLSDFAMAQYHNTTGAEKEVVVGLDSSSTGAKPLNSKEPIYYMVDIIDSPGCTVGGEITCGIDSVTNQARLYQCVTGQVIPMPGGICISGQCTTDGKSCLLKGNDVANADEILASSTLATHGPITSLHENSDTSSTLVKTNGIGSTVYGSCPFMAEPIGPDYFFKIDLNQGDYLTATLKPAATSTGNVEGLNFYLLDIDGKTCITLAQAATTTKKLSEQDLTLNFQALKGGIYYLVVDSFSSTVGAAGSEFEIEYIVDSKGVDNCVKYMTECKDLNTLYVCEKDGIAPIEANCPFGCIGQACRARSATGSFDNCTSTAPAYSTSVAIIYDDNDAALRKDYKITTTNSCGSVTSNANADTDQFVKFDLSANQYINIIDKRSYYYFEPVYYLMPDSACGPPPAYSCLTSRKSGASVDDDGSIPRVTSLSNYVTTVPTTLRLGMTAYSTSTINKNSAAVFIEVADVTCDASTYSCTPGVSAEVTYCSSLSSSAIFTCSTGNCNGKICETNSAKRGNTPYEAIDLDNDPAAHWSTNGTTGVKTGVYTGSTQGLDHSYGSDSSKPSGCDDVVSIDGSGLSRTIGRDAFHKVTLNPGEKIDVSLKRTSSGTDIALYMLKLGDINLTPENKIGPMPTCYGHADGLGSTESFSYTYPMTATGPGDFLIVAAAWTAMSSSDYYDYELTVSITP